MQNRLGRKLKEAQIDKRKLFCDYLTLGFPSLATTERIMLALEKAGTDIIELGFPFSDPLADGPTIQQASFVAIKNGVTLPVAFRLMKSLRKKGLKIPVLLFSYLNPVIHFGISQTIKQLHQSGFDGLIVPDLPPEEGAMWKNWFRQSKLSIVYLAAPTTAESRLKEIARQTTGFIYYVSLKGVTGAREKLPADLMEKIKMIKKSVNKPVLVGFGVSQPEQAKMICQSADGIIVGSALVHCLAMGKKGEGKALALVSRLIRSIRAS